MIPRFFEVKISVATLCDGREVPVRLRWYIDNDRLRGYVVSGYVNYSMIFLECEATYGVRFDYDGRRVELTDVKIDGVEYTPGAFVPSGVHTLTFSAAARNNSVALASVKFGSMQLDGTDGKYRIDFNGGTEIFILSVAEDFKITYCDGKELLGIGEYTYNGGESLAVFEKEGYVFAGWYTDESLTKKIETLNYLSPEDITLYAKFEKKKETVINSGCGSVVANGFCVGIAIGSVIISKRKF